MRHMYIYRITNILNRNIKIEKKTILFIPDILSRKMKLLLEWRIDDQKAESKFHQRLLKSKITFTVKKNINYILEKTLWNGSKFKLHEKMICNRMFKNYMSTPFTTDAMFLETSCELVTDKKLFAHLYGADLGCHTCHCFDSLLCAKKQFNSKNTNFFQTIYATKLFLSVIYYFFHL